METFHQNQFAIITYKSIPGLPVKISSKRQGWHKEQKSWKYSHIDLWIPKLKWNFPITNPMLYRLSYWGSLFKSSRKDRDGTRSTIWICYNTFTIFFFTEKDGFYVCEKSYRLIQVVSGFKSQWINGILSPLEWGQSLSNFQCYWENQKIESSQL